ncbi:MAG: metal-dependent transcriptional regulator [Candidatus Aenigmarchaeota archaeon]|nr:metal-dependent transcriptional regulator [Candidatus Aenigmarchaeota archaeon]
MPGKKDTTESVEEYLETLSRLKEKKKDLTTTNISKDLGISPSSVSEMLRRLSREGYILHKPYRQITLTRKGERVGGKTLRKHRVLERFLLGMGFSRSKIHKEACKLEHYVSDELEGIMKHKLEPPKEGKGVLSLIDIRNGESCSILSIEGGRSSVRRLEDMGLTPGTRITVKKSAPFSGPVEICVRDSCLVIGRGMASRIFVLVGD